MSDLQNKNNVLSKEQSKEYAQSVMNDIKSYNILNKSDVPETSEPLPTDSGNFDAQNNVDYGAGYEPNYDYSKTNYDQNYDYTANYDQNYAVEGNQNYTSNYNLEYDSNNFPDHGYGLSSSYDANQPEQEIYSENDNENKNLDTGLDDELVDSNYKEEDFTDYLLDGDNISSIIVPSSVSDNIDNNMLNPKDVESVIGKYNDTFDYGKNKSFDDSQMLFSKSSVKNENPNVNLYALGFKNPFQKSYSDEFVDYLSKRKIRKILHEKYGIDSKEIIEYLYSKAMFHKWSEIALEKWLLNPSNLELLKRKFIKIKKPSADVINTELDKETKKNINSKEINEETKEINKEMKDSDIKEVVIKVVQDNNYPSKSQEVEKTSFEKSSYSTPTMPTYIGGASNSIKDDLRSVIIEENYRKMQFDLQTEILKSHINDKFSTLSTNVQQNLPMQTQQFLQQPIPQPVQQPIMNSYDFFGGKFPANNNFAVNSTSPTVAATTNINPSETKEKEVGNKNQKTEVKEQTINNKKSDAEIFKKVLSEEMGKISNNFSSKLNTSIKNLNNYVHYLSDAFDKKIVLLEKQMSGIVNKLENDETESFEMEEKIQNVVSEIKNDLMEKLESIEKNKEADNAALNIEMEEKIQNVISEVKNDLMEKLESIEKNKEIDSSTLNIEMEEKIQNVISEVKNDLMEKLESIEKNKEVDNTALNIEMEEKIQNVISEVKNDLMEKLESIEKNKEINSSTWNIALDDKIDEIKTALFSKLENEFEKNAMEFENRANEIDTRLNAIIEDVETRIANTESKHFFEPQIVEEKIINETIDDNINDNEASSEEINDIDFLWKNNSNNLQDNYSNVSNDNSEKQMIDNDNQDSENLNLYDNYLGIDIDDEQIVEKDDLDDSLLTDDNLNQNPNLYDNYLEVGNNDDSEEQIVEKNDSEDLLLTDIDQNQNFENSFTNKENEKVNEAIDKSIDDISEVIDSLQSLDVNNDIIHSLEETSEKFKNVK